MIGSTITTSRQTVHTTSVDDPLSILMGLLFKDQSASNQQCTVLLKRFDRMIEFHSALYFLRVVVEVANGSQLGTTSRQGYT